MKNYEVYLVDHQRDEYYKQDQVLKQEKTEEDWPTILKTQILGLYVDY